MLRKTTFIVLAAMTIAVIAGCASMLDDNWGRSFESARHNQTLNPEADRNLAPVEGLEGPSSERILEGYRQGGQQEKQSSGGLGVLTIQK